jgi:hypothetical protein
MRLTHNRGYAPGPFSCRRRTNRRKIDPVSATCWATTKSPNQATVIEADTKGARIIIPWSAKRGDAINVSYANRIGLYRTEKARIAWTQTLESGRTIAGIYYETTQGVAA